MNYGHHGRDLLLELKRAQAKDRSASSRKSGSSSATSTTAVPPYNDRVVRACLQDLQLHVQALQDQVDAATTATTTTSSSSSSSTSKPSMSVRPSLLLQNAAISRNKRCLLAYHKIRADALTNAYWHNQINVDDVSNNHNNNNNANSNANNSNLCPAEEEFLSSYDQLMRDYAQITLRTAVDLRAHAGAPPAAQPKVQVVVVHSNNNNNNANSAAAAAATPIVLESGATLTLRPGAVHYLPYADIEHLLRDGTLALLSTEEEDDLHYQVQGSGGNGRS